MSARLRIGIVDYGAGNLPSVDQALRAVGASPQVIRTADELATVEALVVPGVGAAGPAMDRLRAADLVDPIRSWVARGRPLLGICLGLQLLYDGSDEDGAETLGLLPGRTMIIPDAPTLPHIGWNQVVRRPARLDDPLFAGIRDGADLYFVHSYAGRPAPEADEAIVGETIHGGRFVSAIARWPLLGLQFHPERSGPVGLRILANAVDIMRVGALAGPGAVAGGWRPDPVGAGGTAGRD
ncbi:MAG TPA: imidazole glycerol phosphate synthase subunit HisH [Candidatus Limnocylindrales bacterium]|nr:imidazole glycerol phosphate synthase subunit HisH [Candidatus Limnocylindrales bacterium]